MKTIATIITTMLTFSAYGEQLHITTSDNALLSANLTNEIIVFNCEGLFVQVTLDDDLGNPQLKDLKFTAPTPTCPKITIDGALYLPAGQIDYHTDFRFFVFQSDNLSNCRTGAGLMPSQFAEHLLLANLETIGVIDIELDVSSWVLNFVSVDGDLSCEGAATADVVFKNGFEVEI